MPQTLSAYNPTWRDSIAQWMLGQSAPTPERRHFVEGLLGSSGLGTTGAGVVDATPIGGLLGAQENAQRGDYKGMALAALPMPAARAKGIIAYHGSPHSFDRFDMSKIGTGEGAQAYGHGLYFAQAEDVAKDYRDKLSIPDYEIRGEKFSQADAYQAVPKVLNELPIRAQWALQNAIERGDPYLAIAELRGAGFEAPSEAVRQILERGDIRKNPTGSMYQVRINADPSQFLDWDKPLSEQSPVVQEAYAKARGATPPPDRNASAAYTDLYLTPRAHEAARNGVDRQAFASQALQEAGIPGIKYLDQGSRGAGEGSRNYVVFDDKLIDILKKYGIVGLLGGGAALGSSAQQQPEM